MYNFLNETNQIYEIQYGFRSDHSCENAVNELISAIMKGFQNNKLKVGLFLDLLKTFDTLKHSILPEKLNYYEIHGIALDWFCSYLTERKIRVKCMVSCTGRTEFSDYQEVTYGTPQGSCLGPLNLVFCNTIMFADDTTLYKTHNNVRYLKWCQNKIWKH